MKEYKVLWCSELFKSDAKVAEKEVNQYAKEGWKVVTCCPHIIGDSGNGLIIIMERDCK